MSLFRGEKLVACLLFGVNDGSSAPVGTVGEVISSSVAIGSAVALTTATPANVTSIVLTPGDWLVSGNVNFAATSASTAVGSAWNLGINTTSATLPVDGTEVQLFQPALTTTTFKDGDGTSIKAISVSAVTTAYLVAQATFTAGSVAAYGSVSARRFR